MFYLLWLTAVQAEVFEADEPEPMPGIGPLNASLKAFAEFFQIDADLVAAAADRSPVPPIADGLDSAARTVIRSLSEMERSDFLMRLYDGEPHVGAELRKRIREGLAEKALVPPIEARTVGELRARAASIARERNRAAEAAAKVDRERREKEQAENRRKRIDALAKRGEAAWREVATEIERRNAASYDRAVKLIADLYDVASAAGKTAEFERRVEAIRQKHVQKGRFVERLSREKFSAQSSQISPDLPDALDRYTENRTALVRGARGREAVLQIDNWARHATANIGRSKLWGCLAPPDNAIKGRFSLGVQIRQWSGGFALGLGWVRNVVTRAFRRRKNAARRPLRKSF